MYFRTFSSIVSAAMLLAAMNTQAASQLFNINANGIKEVNSSGVPNGDPDGSAIGTLLLDEGTGGTSGFAVLSLTLAGLDFPLSAHHIHMAPTNTTGGVFFGLGNPEAMRVGNLLSGTASGLNSALVGSVLANPGAFYYNLHNGPFPGGAVRDQLVPVPEPSTTALAVMGVVIAGTLVRRRLGRRN
jgi:hypothetical protein